MEILKQIKNLTEIILFFKNFNQFVPLLPKRVGKALPIIGEDPSEGKRPALSTHLELSSVPITRLKDKTYQTAYRIKQVEMLNNEIGNKFNSKNLTYTKIKTLSKLRTRNNSKKQLNR